MKDVEEIKDALREILFGMTARGPSPNHYAYLRVRLRQIVGDAPLAGRCGHPADLNGWCQVCRNKTGRYLHGAERQGRDGQP